MTCIYTFEAFPLPIELPSFVDFVCFSNESQYSVWQQKQIPNDILHFSFIRQKKILKILPWKYLPKYDYAIWCESLEYFNKIFLILKKIDFFPHKDIYYLPEESVNFDNYLSLNEGNLNIASQLQKYKASSNFMPYCFINTNLIAFNLYSSKFKQFSINWMNETLKESLNDEISFTYFLSFSSMIDACKCSQIIDDVDCFFKIVIPNYNNGNALEACIESILLQSFKSFKIVIVDDCSTDESVNIAKCYVDKYPEQIFLLSTDIRTYSGHARNIGARYNPFTSKYTWFVDGDDKLYSKDVLKDLYEKASVTNADMISFDCSYVKEGNSMLKKFSIPDFSKSENALEEFGIAPWHRIVKTSKIVDFFENCTRRQDLATVFKQYSNCNTFSHLDKVCYIYHSRDYAKLIEPVWSLQNVYCELIEQSKKLPEKFSKTIIAYLNKYPKVFGDMDYDNIKTQKIVAMASYPLRKKGMLSVFKQMFSQCDYFCLYLNEYDEIPSEFLELSKNDKKRLIIEIGNKNLKDYGKFFWFKKFQGYYLTVDDDLDYPENYCERMIEKMKAFNNNSIIGMHGNDFDIVNNHFVIKKHCHAFLSEEAYNVPIDCIGTGAAVFYPEKINFTFSQILEHYELDDDLDMSISILCKECMKLLYRVSSKKNFIKANGSNLINPLANIHFAWEKRYLQYDIWLHRNNEENKKKKNNSCAFCCVPSDKVNFELFDFFKDVDNGYYMKNIDFYVIPIEDRMLLKNHNDLFFAKFEFVKFFLNYYNNVSIHPLKEKDLRFDFTLENANDMLSIVEKIKSNNVKKISDKILMANLKQICK